MNMLTQAQMFHFDTFGFLVLRGIYSLSEMEEITAAFDQVLDEDRQGQAFTGEKRQAVLGCIEKHPVLTNLVQDDRIYLAMEQLLGKQFIWIGSDGNLYVGDTRWHPDHTNYKFNRIKVAFYLDPVRMNTGCLRVIPGSHYPEYHRMLRPAISENKAETDPKDIPCFPLESNVGDMVIFNQKVWHSAFGGKTGRRMMTLNFGENPVNDEQIADVLATYQLNLNHVKQMQHTQSGRIYEDSFLHHDSPRIRSMTAKLLELNLL